MAEEIKWTSLENAEDVTEEILDIVRNIVDGWYQKRIEWEGVWDRAEGTELADGTRLDPGVDLLSDALKYIRKTILAERKNW